MKKNLDKFFKVLMCALKDENKKLTMGRPSAIKGSTLRLSLLKTATVFVVAILMTFSYTEKSFALGECGMACCLAGASSSGVTNASNFGISVMYENSDMETILSGSTKLSPEEAILEGSSGGMFSVPTSMTMEKVTLVVSRPINERLILTAYVPYIKNNMDMLMGMGMMRTAMTMDEVTGLGDITLMASYNLYTDAPIRPEKRLTVGFGLKAPTGDHTEENAKGKPVHMMMQTGSGSWDAIAFADFMRAFYPLVLRGTAVYQHTGTNNKGFSFGNHYSIDLNAIYNVKPFLNLGLEANYLKTEKDDDRDGYYTNIYRSLPDNPENSGLTSLLGGIRAQVKIPNKPLSFDLLYQQPLHQKVNGIQQVLDERMILSATLVF